MKTAGAPRAAWRAGALENKTSLQMKQVYKRNAVFLWVLKKGGIRYIGKRQQGWLMYKRGVQVNLSSTISLI